VKKNKKKLKLTKLTVANLTRVKGGTDICACRWPDTTDGAWNRDHTGNPCVMTGPCCEL
jgi:hypothetical protein